MFRFHVPQMSCGGCLKGVTAALQTVDRQALVEPDLRAREVTVTTKSHEPAALLEALKKAGYAAELRP